VKQLNLARRVRLRARPRDRRGLVGASSGGIVPGIVEVGNRSSP
jgi:hypothetical protein